MQTEAKEDELRKVFQATASLCVHRGLMTAERALRYNTSGGIYSVCVLRAQCWDKFGAPLLLSSPRCRLTIRPVRASRE